MPIKYLHLSVSPIKLVGSTNTNFLTLLESILLKSNLQHKLIFVAF